jgi:ATP-binding cassette subfamily F protein 3
MSILRLEGVRREIGDFVILDPVSATLARDDRVGLVGANGAGKTTLLEIVAGREEPDGGSVHVARGSRVGLLTQEAHQDPAFQAAASVRAVVRAGADRVEAMERTLAHLEASGAEAVESTEYRELRERFEAADGYSLDLRVEATLAGLGIPRERWAASPGELSGGEQTRVALARLLVADPDLLLLDEPTNHLDIAAIEWLEATLLRRRGALVVASHDRAFLDNVVARIWELRDRRLATFRGAYSAYLVQREQADARSRSVADSTASAIAREEELVQRYRSQRKHVKMHEHERRLAQLRAGRPAASRSTSALRLPAQSLDGQAAARSAEVAVSLEGVVGGHRLPDGGGARRVVQVERLELRRGERVGLVGPNGSGKSTLLRTISGQLPALDGFVRVGRNVQPGHLSQVRDRPLGGVTVLDALLVAAAVTPGAARSSKELILVRGDVDVKAVGEVSGGESSRLELALLGVGSVNLLLLDEPTNHLDIPAREALESFLRESSAALLLVSHDRHLLESVCQRLWVVAPSGDDGPAVVAPFDGGYREWRAAVADGWTAQAALERRRGAGRPSPAIPPKERSTRPRSPSAPGVPSAAQMPARSAAPLSKDVYRRERARIESDLAALGERKSSLERGLEDPSVQANFVELRRLGTELADVDEALGRAEDAWLSLAERAP